MEVHIMLHQPDFTQTKPRTYEQIGHRVQRLIADPRVQRIQSITVSRLPNEDPADWRRVLQELTETAGVRVDEVENGAVKIGWRDYCEA
jgi:hypothetical protein